MSVTDTSNRHGSTIFSTPSNDNVEDEKTLPFETSFRKSSERREAHEKAAGNEKKPSEKPKSTSTVQAFFAVLFEYLFVLLVGFFIGSGCTLIMAAYMIAIFWGKCEKQFKGTAGNLTGSTDQRSTGESKCFTLFYIFIISFSAVALLYMIFKAIRWLYKNRMEKKTKKATDSKDEDPEAKAAGGNAYKSESTTSNLDAPIEPEP